MPTLTTVLNASSFVDGANLMSEALQFLFGKLDSSFRAMQKFEVTISTFSGSTGQASADLNRLLDSSNKLGISFESAAAPFAKFASAADGLSRSQIFEIFDSFATSLSAVRANGSEVNGVFLALQQIVSKGKLSMEELRLQLAERIPGAMKLAAQAAGLGMMEFESAVKKGTIDTSKWLVEFAFLLKDTFGDAAKLAAQTFDASVQRMNNTLLVFNSSLVESSGSGGIWSSILDSINIAMIDNEDVFSSSAIIVKDFSTIAYNLTTTILPALPPILSAISGATHLLSRGIGAVSYVMNGLYISVGFAEIGLLSLKKATLELINPLDVNKAKIIETGIAIQDVYIRMGTYSKNAKAGLNAMFDPYEDIIKKTKELTTAVKETSGAFDNKIKSLDDYTKKLNTSLSEELKAREKVAKDEEKVIEDMYKTAGFGADMYYDDQAQALVQQVADWQKHGADVYKSNQWLYTQLTSLSEEAWSKGETSAGQALDAYSAMHRTLVDQFNSRNDLIKQTIEDMSQGVDGLNAKEINIVARLDGGAVIAGVDSLIRKFSDLQTAASAASAAKASPYTSYDSSRDGSYSDFLDRRDNAGYGSTSDTTIINNFNQQQSRSDITNQISEQNRQAVRN